MSDAGKKQTWNTEKRQIWEEKLRQNPEFYDCIRDLLEHPAVLAMKQFPHHADVTCYDHCLNVAYYNYEICRLFGLNAVAAARAGMLHDLFLYDWHTHARKTGERFHGLTHPRAALQNAQRYFKLSPLEQDIILKHMWPLTFVPPRYPEAYVICMTDKYSGAREVADYYAGKVRPPKLRLPWGYRSMYRWAARWLPPAVKKPEGEKQKSSGDE